MLPIYGGEFRKGVYGFTVIMLYLFLYLVIEYDHSSSRAPLSVTTVSPQMTSTITLTRRPELCGPFDNPSSLEETHCPEPNSVHKHVVLSRQQAHVVCMHHMPLHWGSATVKASFFRLYFPFYLYLTKTLILYTAWNREIYPDAI